MAEISDHVDNHILNSVMETLTGHDFEEAEGDRSGTYFDRDHWVSVEGIAQALVDAFEHGYEMGHAHGSNGTPPAYGEDTVDDHSEK